jgi:hypothetical protein
MMMANNMKDVGFLLHIYMCVYIYMKCTWLVMLFHYIVLHLLSFIIDDIVLCL